MLKDLADSKRLDANIRDLPRQQALQQQTVQQLPEHVATALAHTRATVCSYLFWPELPEHEMVLPDDLHEALQVLLWFMHCYCLCCCAAFLLCS